jgi:hypothetical protein
MKTKILSIVTCASLLSLSALAQVTVTAADLAPLGDVIIIAHDSVPATAITPGAAGTGKTWSFTTLKNQKHDSVVFTSATGTPGIKHFPSANVQIGTNKATYAYAQATASAFSIVGAYGLIFTDTVFETYTPASTMMKWPSSLGTTYNDDHTVSAKARFHYASFDSLRVKNIAVSSCTIDAWGTITTPLGSFSAIRQMRHSINTDSTWLHQTAPPNWILYQSKYDTVDHYSWWTNTPTVGYPIVEMDYSPSFNTVSNVTWMYVKPSPQAVTEHTELSGFLVYPNPANDRLNLLFKTNNAVSVSLLDMTGRLIATYPVTQHEITQLNTTGLINGMYLVVVTNNKGEMSTQKISVIH